MALGKLQVVSSSQTMLCLFIVGVSRQLASPSFPQGMNNGQAGSFGRKASFLAPLNIVVFELGFCGSSSTEVVVWPESCSRSAVLGVGCLFHLDTICRETGGDVLFMTLPVKTAMHSS